MHRSSNEASMPEKPTMPVTIRIEPLLLRKEEAARALALSPRTFEDLVLAGLIGKVQIGGLVLYDTEELRSFVERVRREGLSKSRIADLIERNKSQRQPSPANSKAGQRLTKMLSPRVAAT
jgi:hypothetical protein